MLELDRPEAGDKILQKWASDLVKALRNNRLASNEFFDIKQTERGTIITLKKFKKKYRLRIAFKGIPSRFFVAQNKGDTWYYTDNPEDIDVQIYPLGYTPVRQYFKEGSDGKTFAHINEMVDGDPIYNGNFTVALNTTTKVDIEIEEEE